MLQLSEEFSSGGTHLRFDIYGSQPREHVLDELAFLAYRLASVTIEPKTTRPEPDIVWDQDAPGKSIRYDGKTLYLDGEWYQGEVQTTIVSMLALRMEQLGLHPFHSSAIRYRDRTILFISGESNHGKTMSQIEGSRRGGLVISTETTVIDEQGLVVTGSKSVFLRTRSKGTERADKPNQDQGVAKFFDETPDFITYDEPCDVDLVIVPAIDGNYATQVTELNQFEREFQTMHSVMDYLGMHLVLAPGIVMPLLDNDELRTKRADFVHRFAVRPYYFIRAANPQLMMDEVEKLL
jgi:hypothetical protein